MEHFFNNIIILPILLYEYIIDKIYNQKLDNIYSAILVSTTITIIMLPLTLSIAIIVGIPGLYYCKLNSIYLRYNIDPIIAMPKFHK